MAKSAQSAEELLDQIVGLLALSLVREAESQAEAIATLLRAGLGTNRVAELLGTTPATVRAARAAAGKAGKKSSRKR